MDFEHTIPRKTDVRLLAGLSDAPKLERIDTSVVSLVRATGDHLLQLSALDHSLFVVPMRPMHLAWETARPRNEVVLRLCPYTVCVLHAGYDFEFSHVRCDDVLVIGVEPNWLYAVKQRCVAEDVPLSRPVDTLLHPDVPPMIHAFQRHLSHAECPDEPYLPMMTELLLARFFWHRQRHGSDRTPPQGLTTGKLHGVLLAIEDQLHQRILVASLARSVSMSPSRFSRAFKATLGVSPQRYILERRVLRVQDLLEQTGLSLTDVSLEAGFSSQAHMTAMFARHFGITPGEYRKHVKGRSEPRVRLAR